MAQGDVTVNLTAMNTKRCAVFDGVDDYVSVSGDNIFVNGIQTISVWFRVRDGGLCRVLSHPETATVNRVYITLDSSESLNVTIGSSTLTHGVVNVNEWYHVLVVRDQTNSWGKLWVNGEESVSVAVTTIGSEVTQDITIGSLNTSPTEVLKGDIRDVKIWNRELSDTEKVQDYNNELITDGLIHRWKLDFDYKDSVGSNDGTNVGSVLASVESDVAQAIADARVTANDKYMISVVNGKIMTSVIEEA